MEIQDGNAKFKTEYNPIMPNGSIITFSGSFTEEGYPIDNQTGVVYTNWHVCNGEEGTVDLRGKFILGSSDTHEVGEVGGEETHTLTTAEIPSHAHIYRVNSGSNEAVWGPVSAAPTQIPMAPCTTEPTGGGEAHNNMPPYHTVKPYICCV